MMELYSFLQNNFYFSMWDRVAASRRGAEKRDLLFHEPEKEGEWLDPRKLAGPTLPTQSCRGVIVNPRLLKEK